MCQMLNIWHIFGTPNTIWPHLSDVPYLIFFVTCYSILINLPLYETGVAYIFILFVFLFLSHISFIFSFSSLPPSLLSYISLSSSPSAHRISLSSSPSAHCLHLYSLIYLFLLFLQLTASISTLWHCRFGVLSLTLPIWCSLFLLVADSRISELPISSLFYLRVVDSLFAV